VLGEHGTLAAEISYPGQIVGQYLDFSLPALAHGFVY
jgi:hypothetical protein